MTRKRSTAIALLVLGAWMDSPTAQATGDDGNREPITLEEVLASVEAHHPVIHAARARAAGAGALQVAAEGAFDPTLELSGQANPLGYYGYARANAAISQYLGVMGASAFAGYRYGGATNSGGIPDYLGGVETLDAGEVRIGVAVPLLRDGLTDARRTAIERGRLAASAGDFDVVARVLRTQLSAADAYAKWVSAGEKLSIANALRDLAEERDQQIRARVAAGALAQIEAIENQRAVLERRQTVVSAQRAFERASLQLAMFLRDARGRPRLAAIEELPPASGMRIETPATSEVSAISRALEQRPDLQRARAIEQSAYRESELRDNQVLPRLDLSATGSADLGTGSANAVTRLSPPALEIGATFSIPLGLRDPTGRRDAARSEATALRFERELLEDQVTIEVRDALSALRAAVASVELASANADVAERVAAAERTRFEAGATTLLFVNLREAIAGAARASLADARAEHTVARVWVDLVDGDAR